MPVDRRNPSDVSLSTLHHTERGVATILSPKRHSPTDLPPLSIWTKRVHLAIECAQRRRSLQESEDYDGPRSRVHARSRSPSSPLITVQVPSPSPIGSFEHIARDDDDDDDDYDDERFFTKGKLIDDMQSQLQALKRLIGSFPDTTDSADAIEEWVNSWNDEMIGWDHFKSKGEDLYRAVLAPTPWMEHHITSAGLLCDLFEEFSKGSPTGQCDKNTGRARSPADDSPVILSRVPQSSPETTYRDARSPRSMWSPETALGTPAQSRSTSTSPSTKDAWSGRAPPTRSPSPPTPPLAPVSSRPPTPRPSGPLPRPDNPPSCYQVPPGSYVRLPPMFSDDPYPVSSYPRAFSHAYTVSNATPPVSNAVPVSNAAPPVSNAVPVSNAAQHPTGVSRAAPNPVIPWSTGPSTAGVSFAQPRPMTHVAPTVSNPPVAFTLASLDHYTKGLQIQVTELQRQVRELQTRGQAYNSGRFGTLVYGGATR